MGGLPPQPFSPQILEISFREGGYFGGILCGQSFLANDLDDAGDEAGSGNTDDSADPHWREYTAKWINTTEQITRVRIIMGSGYLESGACMTVWGADAASPTTFNYPNGTLFEESDTGKHYMFDGTSAWNEIT